MAKARFAYTNLLAVSGVTITSSSEATARPDDYAVHPSPWKKWRSSTTTGDQWIKFDLGSNQAMQCALLSNWKRHTGGTIKFQAHTSDAWGAPTVDETFTIPSTNPTKVIAKWLSASQNLRWVRFLFTNTGAVSDYVEVGVAFVGPYFGPSFNLSDGFKFRRVDQSLIVKSDGGNRSAHQKDRYYCAEGVFEYVPEADKDSFVTMFETNGVFTPLFFAVDPDDPDQIVYGAFDGELNVSHVVRSQWNIPFKFEEVL